MAATPFRDVAGNRETARAAELEPRPDGEAGVENGAWGVFSGSRVFDPLVD